MGKNKEKESQEKPILADMHLDGLRFNKRIKKALKSESAKNTRGAQYTKKKR